MLIVSLITIIINNHSSIFIYLLIVEVFFEFCFFVTSFQFNDSFFCFRHFFFIIFIVRILFVFCCLFYNQFVKIFRSMYAEKHLQSRWRRRLHSIFQFFFWSVCFHRLFYLQLRLNKSSIHSRFIERDCSYDQFDNNRASSINWCTKINQRKSYH